VSPRSKGSSFKKILCIAAGFVLCAAAFARATADDIILADFEGDDYGHWVAAGEAFDTGPARGAFPAQAKLLALTVWELNLAWNR